jgi:hypothetical protein
MASIELKAKIVAVGPCDFVGENKTPKQDIIVMVPGFVDGFGDKVGKDEQWKISVMGDNVAKLGIAPNAVDKKAKLKVYLNSNCLPAREAGKDDMYIINAVLASIEIIP